MSRLLHRAINRMAVLFLLSVISCVVANQFNQVGAWAHQVGSSKTVAAFAQDLPISSQQLPAAPQGRDVLIRITDPSQLSKSKVLQATDAFELSAVTVERRDTLSSLLASYGIKPDPYSYGLIMDLNPEIKKLDDLKEGQEITLPKLDYKSLEGYGYRGRMALAAHPDEYNKLGGVIKEIDDQMATVVKMGVVHFPNDEAKERLLKVLTENQRLLRKTRTVALNKATLERVNKLAKSISNLIEANTGETRISIELAAALESTQETLEFIVESAEAFVNQKPVPVSVTTKKNNGQLAPELLVRCKLESDYLADIKKNRSIDDNAIPFDRLTNPGTKDLDEYSYYYFWVVDERVNPVRRVREPERRRIERNTKPCETGEHCMEFFVTVP